MLTSLRWMDGGLLQGSLGRAEATTSSSTVQPQSMNQKWRTQPRTQVIQAPSRWTNSPALCNSRELDVSQHEVDGGSPTFHQPSDNTSSQAKLSLYGSTSSVPVSSIGMKRTRVQTLPPREPLSEPPRELASAPDALYSGLSFPPFYPGGAALQRRVSIPAQFFTPHMYIKSIISALVEEVNLRLSESAQPFHSAVQRSLLPTGGGGGSSDGRKLHQQPKQQHQQGAGGIPGLRGACGGLVGDLEKICVQSRVPYFSGCELKKWQPHPASGRGRHSGSKRGKSSREGEGDDGAAEEAVKAEDPRYYLTIAGLRGHVKNSRWVGGLMCYMICLKS